MTPPSDRSAATDERPVVLITGAGSGIGAATATAFADRGWTVYATDIEVPLPDSVGTCCRTLELDVTDATQCRDVVDRIVTETGRIDALINNAGYAVLGPVEDVPIEATREEFDVLVAGTHRLVQLVVPIMRDQRRGRIVTVSSVLGLSAYPGMGAYCAGKAAVESLTDALRMELRDVPGVETSLVEPAWVDTDFADSAIAQLADRGQTDRYGETYDGLERGWVVDGGPLATDPETVAGTIVEAATASEPDARYPVGAFARFVRVTHWLPASIQDPLRRSFGRTSVRARSLYELFEADESDREARKAHTAHTAGATTERPDSSTLTLSTGHTVSLPLSTEATIVGATVSAALDPVEGLLPPGLAPVRVTPSRGVLTVLCVAYERIGDGGLEPYSEVAIMVAATPQRGSAPFSTPLTGEVGAYVWQLPVTTEPARALGVEGWQYPKSVAAIDIDDRDGQRRTTVARDGEHVCSIAIDRPRTVPGTVSLRSYTADEGKLLREPLTLDGRLGAAPLSRAVSITLGTHPWADTLRSLDLGSRALARVGFAGEFTIHAPEPIDRS